MLNLIKRLISTQNSKVLDFNFHTILEKETWVEDKIIRIVVGSYRHEIVALCSSLGRQEAEFANGTHKYFTWCELLGKGNKRIEQGVSIVPILPDGRFIMVVEQRPPQGKVDKRSHLVDLSGGPIDLRSMGAYSSLEFPGGAIDHTDKSLQSGFLRELVQETGVENQTATLYQSLKPVWSFGSDIPVKAYFGAAFLSGMSYPEKVEDDGGLYVLALTKSEVLRNIANGVISSGQAAILPWNFFRDVEMAREDDSVMKEFLRSKYLIKEEVQLRT